LYIIIINYKKRPWLKNCGLFLFRRKLMNFREARFKSGLTQYDLTLRTGIQQSKISLFERGYLKPRNNERSRIAKALEIGPEEINWDGKLNELDRTC
jgi:transcriptional regulator with XRE-family HTH domain